jgi:CubicO group peptidase (beta-lactamase class C family)
MRPSLLVASLTFAAVASVPVVTHPAPQDPRVDSIMRRLIRPTDPGASVIVIHRGKILHEAGYGMADLGRGIPNTSETLYHMASSSKQFTALAIMMLKEKRQLRYGDPIARHLPQLKRFGDDVTIEDLLHHISALPDYYDDSTGYSKLMEISRTPVNGDILTLYQTWGDIGVCCHEFRYNNSGYDLLGSLVEYKAKQSLDAFLQQHVFVPLGMTSTFSMPNPRRFADRKRARGYDRNGNLWSINDYDPLDGLIGAGSVYSSVRDLFYYDQALYTDKLVSQATLAEAFKPAILSDGDTSFYGFGWRLGELKGHRFTGHGGSWEGYLSHILRFPEDQFSIFVLANRTDIDPEEIAVKVFEMFEPTLTP